jgi:predicted DNA-binding antitoxin AbrB/MazE fold protein
MKMKKSWSLVLCLTFVLALLGCRQSETRGARVILKLEEVSFFVSKPIKYVELTHGERMLIHLDDEDAKSLTELLRETEELSVNVYFGENFYDTVKVFKGEDYSTINLPYRTSAEEILREEGIDIR